MRHWTLGGTNGSMLTETITASSAGQALEVPFQEAIPSSIASSLQTVRFSPAPTRIVRADPVVEWELQVPAEGSVTVGYDATVSCGWRHPRQADSLGPGSPGLQAQLPAPHSSRPARHAPPSATPSTQVPATVQPRRPPRRQQSQTTNPRRNGPPAPGLHQRLADDRLVVHHGPGVFGQLGSVISALSGQVTFNTSASLQAAEPACASAPWSSARSATQPARSTPKPGIRLDRRGECAEPRHPGRKPSPAACGSPGSTSAGQAWQGSAQLVAGNLTVQSGTYGLNLRARNGTAQTWLVDGQTVTCNS